MHLLVTIPFSHFCEKARWSLDHARVPYVEEGHAPIFHMAAVRRAGGRRSVPVLVLENGGGVLDDSPLIVRWADARATSDRKLLPPDGPARDDALALERRLDVDFAPHVRRLAYFHLLADRPLSRRVMGLRTPRREGALVGIAFPLVRRVLQRAMAIEARSALDSRDRVRRTFDRIGERLRDGRPYLLGDRFGAADITFAAFASPLLLPEGHALADAAPLDAVPEALAAEIRALRETAAGRFTLRLYREHRARG
jgi:glutathione S-transferase